MEAITVSTDLRSVARACRYRHWTVNRNPAVLSMVLMLCPPCFSATIFPLQARSGDLASMTSHGSSAERSDVSSGNQ